MKRAYYAGVIAAVFLSGCAADEEPLAGLPGPVPEGVTFYEAADAAPPAPGFELDLVNGEVVAAESAWTDRPIVMVFFESWCEICRDQQPAINELAKDYEDIVLFLGIAGVSTEDDVIDYVHDNDVPYPVGIDAEGGIWLNYAAAEPPLVALVTRGGKVARGWPGGIEGDQLRDQIDEVLVQSTG